MRRIVIRSLPVVFLLALSVTARAGEAPPADVLFARKVLPLFKARCIVCHGENPEKLKGDFDMRTRASLLEGGERGRPSIVPGEPLQSPLYPAATREYDDDWAAMPPKENDKLSGVALWLAGGGVNRGATVSATDEMGDTAVDVVHPIRDLHVTLLRLLGLDDNKLTYFHGGRFKQLSQIGG